MRHSVFFFIGALTVLSGCSSVKETLGMEREAPDEFAVVERAPLTVPPNFNLVPPQPGAARPQESTTQSAKGLVLGSESSAPAAETASRAEQALLSKTGAVQVSPAIRQQLAQPEPEPDNRSVAEKLGMVGSDPETAQGKALDPMQEAKRLEDIRVNTPPVKDPSQVDQTPAKNAKKQ